MNKQELIDKYFSNSLNEDESRLFDELLKIDQAFKDDVDLLEDLKKVAELEDTMTTREMVADFEVEHQSKSNRFNFKTWLVAASLVLLVGLGYVFNRQQSVDPQLLFTENFEPYRNVVQPIVRGSSQEDLKTKAFILYEKEEYEEAIELFDKLYNETKTSYYLFYKANGLLELNRPKAAIAELKEHVKTDDTLTQKTNWYLAMAYLKLDDIDKAKEFLNLVVATKQYNTKKAKIILDALE